MERDRDAHWQEAWRAAGLATARRVPGREKFYALVAYPGPSGFLHVGHMRGLVYADALHRYHRMLGHQVLFPFGVHASGLPAVAYAQRVKDRNPDTLRELEENGVPPTERSVLEEPEAVARFFGRQYIDVFLRMGLLIDESTYLTTIDADYQAFIRWQFRTLHRRGALVQGTYFSSVCPVCGPVAVDLAETDLSQGGAAEVLCYTTVPFALEDGRVLLTATLRPETVYGVTNLWVNAAETLVVWHHAGRLFIVSRAAAERLVDQHGGTVGHSVPVEEIVGRTVEVPETHERVPVVASPVVDPTRGTGVVMSVPAHAPADAVALAELPGADRDRVPPPRAILEVPDPETWSASERALMEGDGLPAERAARATGARTLADTAALDEATERLYRFELARGRMTESPVEGVPVREARERVAEKLLASGLSFDLREFSERVVCRNGHDVVIRRVPDQWFLHYGDPAWKAELRAKMGGLLTRPEGFATELQQIIDWFDDRPCTRRGRWLGTPFPLDPEWLIEPIADSTFYPAYYIVRRFVHSGRLTPEQLTDALFDYVFLGEGPGEPRVDRPLQEEIREEYLYWYPLDLNIGGKEHKRVHFPAFLYTHARLLPVELQPKGIFVHHWVTRPAGGKISKKDVGGKHGLVPPIRDALERWGADGLRLYYVAAASPGQDIAWDPGLVDDAAARLEEIERLVRALRGDAAGPPELEEWLESEFRRRLVEARAAFASSDLRTAGQVIYVDLPAVFRRYLLRGGVAGRRTEILSSAWIRLLAPITPHLAEELGAERQSSLIAVERLPAPDDFRSDPSAEQREAFLERVEDDLRDVLRPALERNEPPPDEAIFFIASPWKRTLERWLRDAVEQGHEPTVKEIMDRAGSHPELTGYRSEIPGYVRRIAPHLRAEAPLPVIEDEGEALRAASGYLIRRFGFGQVIVYPEAEAAPHDPLDRRERARPGRPAFYLVRPGDPHRRS